MVTKFKTLVRFLQASLLQLPDKTRRAVYNSTLKSLITIAIFSPVYGYNNFISSSDKLTGWIVKWAHLGSNHRPPDYEFPTEVSIRLHTFVSVCTSISYNTLKVKYYTGLHGFVEILVQPSLKIGYFRIRQINKIARYLDF